MIIFIAEELVSSNLIIMPIFLAPVDEIVTITHIHSDVKVAKHLRELGLIEGAKVRILSNEVKSVIVEVRGVRLALDREVANAILVS